MGLISKVIGIGAIVGAFYIGRNTFPDCKVKELAPSGTTDGISCSNPTEIPFEGLDAITGIIGPDSTQVHYLTSTKSSRRGYLFRNASSGEQGILVENTFTRKPMYIPLEQRLDVPSPLYHSQPTSQTQPTLWRRLARDTVNYFTR